MRKKKSFFLLLSLWLCMISSPAIGFENNDEHEEVPSGISVKKEDRRTLVSTEYGEITAVGISDQINGHYVLNFFTLDPNSLFIPHILQAEMVFYVHTGSGRLSWTDGDDGFKSTDLRPGDVYSLEEGSIFFIQSNLETSHRNKLRIHAIFTNFNTDSHETKLKPYTSLIDALLGFDRRVLQSAFRVSDDVIDELLAGSRPPEIIHGTTKMPEKKKNKATTWAMNDEIRLLRSLVVSTEWVNRKSKESVKLFNIFKEDKDFVNNNGWSTTVTGKKLSVLRISNMGLYMVNLTGGSMMGPHWNPTGSEISIVLEGRGMVRIISSNTWNKTAVGNRNNRFQVEEGDVFVAPRFSPMAQMSFSNETFLFVGFSTSAKRNYPQFLAGKASVLKTFDRKIMGMAFNATDRTAFDRIVDSQEESVILRCENCAEEEWRIIEEMEEERRREEEARRQEEEKRRREEEEESRREEEAARRQEEEKRRREEEEERRREEEEKRRREEEEEEERRREEEAARRQEEEKRRREEEEERRREEEEARRQEEEKRRREEEEEEERRREEEAARRQEEEHRREEEEESRREEEEEARRQEEEKRRREEEEERRIEKEEKRRRETRHKEEEEEERRRGYGPSEWERAAEAQRRWEEELEREEEEAARRRKRYESRSCCS